MNFNTFALVYSGFWTVACVLIYLASSRLKRILRIGARPGQNEQSNAAFRACQRRFLLGYAPCLLADGLQAPYLYHLFAAVGLAPTQIAGLYALGYVASAVAAVGILHVSDIMERRLLCLSYIATTVFGCLFKLSDSFHLLAISRIFDGVSAALLSLPFNQWYTAEHIRTYDFPKEWLSSTLRRVTILGGFCAIIAGNLAEASVRLFDLPPMPFLLAVPVLIASGFIMRFAWQPHRSVEAASISGVSQPQTNSDFKSGLSRILRSINLLIRDAAGCILFVVQALYESALLLFIFVCTPVFLEVRVLIRTLPSLGLAYACMAACALFGQQACAVLLASVGSQQVSSGERKYAAGLAALSLSLASSLTSVALILTLGYSGHQKMVPTYNTILALFAMLHMSAGSYYAALPVVQKYTLRSITDRPSLGCLSRISRCCLATLALLTAGGGVKSVLGAGAVSLALALAASLALGGVALARRRRRPPAQDYVVLRQMDQAAEESDADDVFA